MRILVTGSNGQVGFELCRIAEKSEHEWLCLDRSGLDITSEVEVDKVVTRFKPNIVINAAAYTAVDKAETEKNIALSVNAYGPMYLAQACQRVGAALLHISTDYVFSGNSDKPYSEDDDVEPTGHYGVSKLKGEHLVAEYCERHIILRTSWVFGVHGNNFVKTMLRLSKDLNTISVVADQYGAPTSAKGIARTLVFIISQIKEKEIDWGIYHYSGFPYTTWYGFAKKIFDDAYKSGLIEKQMIVKAIKTIDYPTPAKRPANSRLDNTKISQNFSILPDNWKSNIKQSIKQFI